MQLFLILVLIKFCDIKRIRDYLRFMQLELLNLRKAIIFYVKFKLSLINYNL
jgi:hypothetical protein